MVIDLMLARGSFKRLIATNYLKNKEVIDSFLSDKSSLSASDLHTLLSLLNLPGRYANSLLKVIV